MSRTIRIAPETSDMLKTWKEDQNHMRQEAGPLWTETGYVFTKETGNPMAPDSITQWLDTPLIHPSTQNAKNFLAQKVRKKAVFLSKTAFLVSCAPKKDIRRICLFPPRFLRKAGLFSCASTFFMFARKRYQVVSFSGTHLVLSQDRFTMQ